MVDVEPEEGSEIAPARCKPTRDASPHCSLSSVSVPSNRSVNCSDHLLGDDIAPAGPALASKGSGTPEYSLRGRDVNAFFEYQSPTADREDARCWMT